MAKAVGHYFSAISIIATTVIIEGSNRQPKTVDVITLMNLNFSAVIAFGCAGGLESVVMKPLTRVYHLAEVANWSSIQRDGLHSASRLLDIAGVVGPARDRLERSQRLQHSEIPSGAQLRDQRPMPPTALNRCLIGMMPAEWYAMINARIFFWLDPQRLNRHRAACEPRPQIVLTVDVSKLVASYADHIALTPINTGNARRLPAKRGTATFVPYTAWLATGWASEAAGLGTRMRPYSHVPVELTVATSIPDVMRFVVDVQELSPGQAFSPATE